MPHIHMSLMESLVGSYFLEFLPYFMISALPLTATVFYVGKIFPLLKGNCPFGLLHPWWLGTINTACNGPILLKLMLFGGLIDPFFSVVFNKDDGKGLVADSEEIKNGLVQIFLEEQLNQGYRRCSLPQMLCSL